MVFALLYKWKLHVRTQTRVLKCKGFMLFFMQNNRSMALSISYKGIRFALDYILVEKLNMYYVYSPYLIFFQYTNQCLFISNKWGREGNHKLVWIKYQIKLKPPPPPLNNKITYPSNHFIDFFNSYVNIYIMNICSKMLSKIFNSF